MTIERLKEIVELAKKTAQSVPARRDCSDQDLANMTNLARSLSMACMENLDVRSDLKDMISPDRTNAFYRAARALRLEGSDSRGQIPHIASYADVIQKALEDTIEREASKRSLIGKPIFYSWQNDTPPKVNRWFIREALELVIKDVAKDVSFEEAPRLDYDTKGVPGNPPIAETILEKIDACGIFVPDLTYVARTEEGKCIPNPNVLIELGYARKSIGVSRTIFVMNEAFGKFDEGMPFDLLYLRKPICYTLHENASTDSKRQVRDTFVKDLAFAIRNIIESSAIVLEQQQRPSLALHFVEPHEHIDDIFSKDGMNDRIPVRNVSFNFLVENTSNVPVTDITVGVIAWAFSNGENLAPVTDALRSQLEVIPEQSDFYPRLTLQHHAGKDGSKLDPFLKLGIRRIGPYCFPHDLASAKVTCAVYLRSQDTPLTWFQLDFDYLSRFERAFQKDSPKYTLIPKGQERPRVSWQAQTR